MSHIGRRGALAIGLEATPGAGTVSAFASIPYLSCDLNEVHTPIADLSAKGVRDEQGSNSALGKKSGQGNIEVALNPETCPYWFGLALGSIASTTEGALYTGKHTINRKANNEPLTALIYRDRVVDKVSFSNAVVNTLELNFADDIAKLSMNILSKAPAVADETIAVPSTEIFTFRNAYVELTNNSTTSALKVRDFTLNINNNAEMIYAPGSNDVDRIVSKQFGVGGSINIDFEGTTQRDAFMLLTKQKINVVFQGESSKITIEVPQFRVDNRPLNTPNDDISMETIDFVAEYDGTKSVGVVVENETASY
jgi:hypothetical protein